MNKDRTIKKIKTKYGVEPSELCQLSTSKIKNLKAHSIVDKNAKDRFKVVKKPLGIIAKGGSIGAGLAGSINTIFPNIVPVIGSAITEASNISPIEKALGLTALASKPVDIISGPTVVGIGALTGAIIYSGYRLIKSGADTILIKIDRNKAKKLELKK